MNGINGIKVFPVEKVANSCTLVVEPVDRGITLWAW